MSMKLTNKSIEALPVSDRDIIIFDSELKRFGIRIKPGEAAARSFLIQYRNSQGKSRKHTIGAYGLWTPEQARKHAKELLRHVDAGRDPAEETKENRDAITIGELCDLYIAAGKKGLLISKRGK